MTWPWGRLAATPRRLRSWSGRTNHGQSPGGSLQGQVALGGRGYEVWRGLSSTGFQYVAFVADQNFTSGTVDLLGFFTWMKQKG
jgi:hypothetical protein